MIEYKQQMEARVPVRLYDEATGSPKTSVTYGQVTVTVERSDGTLYTHTVTETGWQEQILGAFQNTGKYTLTLPASALTLAGIMTYAVAVTGARTYIGVVKVVAAEEIDTKTVADAIQAKTDNLPLDPAKEATVASRLAAASYLAPDNALIAAIKSRTDNLPIDPASDTSVLSRASQVSVNNIPVNPLLTSDARLGYIDVSISSRLSSGSYIVPDNASISAIKAKTDSLPSDPASQSLVEAVVASAGITLSEIEASTVLAKQATLEAIPTNPLLTTDSRLSNLDVSISSRLSTADYDDPASILDMLILDHLQSGSVGETLALIRGLVQHNYSISNVIYNGSGLLTSGKIGIFRSKSDTDDNTNPIATYTISATPVSASNQDMVGTYKVTRD